MFTPENIESLYNNGYHKIPTLKVDGEPAFSTVAHRRGLSELAWAAEVQGLLDAASDAIHEGNTVIAQWLHDKANLMLMERGELDLSNPHKFK